MALAVAKDHASHSIAALERCGYVARLARDPQDIAVAQRLRHLCFVERAGRPTMPDALDKDAFDDICDHVLIEDPSGQLMGTCRVQLCQTIGDLCAGYTGQFYDLSSLQDGDGPFLELGRFCVADGPAQADVLRLAWAFLARIVDIRGAAMLLGCSSFAGRDFAAHKPAFDLLAERTAPCRIGRKAAETIDYRAAATPVTDRRAALDHVPALLRSYLSMGGWVSDHAVVDRDMNTLHVFTGLRIADIPNARAAALRALAT